jgi:hypothetical protein
VRHGTSSRRIDDERSEPLRVNVQAHSREIHQSGSGREWKATEGMSLNDRQEALLSDRTS